MQRHPEVLANSTQQWITLIIAYARNRRLWTLRVEDAELKDGDWSEVFWNPRIRRSLDAPSPPPPSYSPRRLMDCMYRSNPVCAPGIPDEDDGSRRLSLLRSA